MTRIKLIRPYVELKTELDEDKILKEIELDGRTCYKSEDKITPTSAQRFVEARLNQKRVHWGLFRHNLIKFKIVTDRGIENEIVRHQHSNYLVESTRYINYQKRNSFTYIIPPWISHIWEDSYDDHDIWKMGQADGSLRDHYDEYIWAQGLIDQTERYIQLSRDYNWSPEKARNNLPLSLKSEIIMSGSIHQWYYVLDLRTELDNHFQMREVMNMVLSILQQKLPTIFNRVNPGEVKC
jgi:thymidylate synthase (FAD)